jgi:hypothetical protein
LVRGLLLTFPDILHRLPRIQAKPQTAKLVPEFSGEYLFDWQEVPVYRLVLLAGATLFLWGCSDSGMGPGKVIFTEDTESRFIQVREGRGGYVMQRSAYVANRPDLKDLHELHASLDSLCRDFHGFDNPRIVIESKNQKSYQVVYASKDRDDVLKVIAKPLGLQVTQEDRDIDAVTLRVSPGGHRLKSTMKDLRGKAEEVGLDSEQRWQLDGVTTEELARFLESRFQRPVVDLTGLEGRWSILLSYEAGSRWPPFDKNARPVQPPDPKSPQTVRPTAPRKRPAQPLDDLGLELFEQRARMRVTVVKDAPSDERK